MFKSLRYFALGFVFSVFTFMLAPLAGLVDRASAALSLNTSAIEGSMSTADLVAYNDRAVTIEQSYRAHRAWELTAAAK